MPGFTLWKGLKTIAIVTSLCLRDGKETIEVRYYISSLAMGVKELARAVRGHWGIENTCHWVLDVTYREDESRIREKLLRENMAWLNRFAIGKPGDRFVPAGAARVYLGDDAWRETVLDYMTRRTARRHPPLSPRLGVVGVLHGRRALPTHARPGGGGGPGDDR